MGEIKNYIIVGLLVALLSLVLGFFGYRESKNNAIKALQEEKRFIKLTTDSLLLKMSEIPTYSNNSEITNEFKKVKNGATVDLNNTSTPKQKNNVVNDKKMNK